MIQSVDGLGLAARSVRDQLSNDTWMVLANVERALAQRSDPPQSLAEADTLLASAHARTVGRDADAVGGGQRVDGARRRLDDDGHRQTHRAQPVADRVAAGHADHASRSAAAEQTVIESTLVACESSVIYRRRTVGQVSVAAVTELMLFDANNPRSLLYQLERLRADLKDLPSSSGSSRPERMVDEISTLLRRSHPAELEGVDSDGRAPS